MAPAWHVKAHHRVARLHVGALKELFQRFVKQRLNLVNIFRALVVSVTYLTFSIPVLKIRVVKASRTPTHHIFTSYQVERPLTSPLVLLGDYPPRFLNVS